MKNEDNENKLKSFLTDIGEEEVYLADGLSDAFIGVASVEGTTVAVYSTGLIAIQLMNEGMSYADAEEYIQYNIMGANIGKDTPIYVDLIPEEYWKNN